jgi:hypothetical protein
MNEEKLKLVLEQLITWTNTTLKLSDLQAEENKNVVLRMFNLQEQINVLSKAIKRLESENLTKSERIT